MCLSQSWAHQESIDQERTKLFEKMLNRDGRKVTFTYTNGDIEFTSGDRKYLFSHTSDGGRIAFVPEVGDHWGTAKLDLPNALKSEVGERSAGLVLPSGHKVEGKNAKVSVFPYLSMQYGTKGYLLGASYRTHLTDLNRSVILEGNSGQSYPALREELGRLYPYDTDDEFVEIPPLEEPHYSILPGVGLSKVAPVPLPRAAIEGPFN